MIRSEHGLFTYPLIQDCARCRDCGRNVHDYDIPDKIWLEVIGSEDGVWCYDCFCNRADRKFGVIEHSTLISIEDRAYKWRLRGRYGMREC